MNQEPHDMTHIRADDHPPLKVTREIPLPWLIGIVGAGFLQATLVYYKQDDQTKQISALSAEVRQLSVDIGTKNLKDVEHDLKIADHERRILSLEAARAIGK